MGPDAASPAPSRPFRGQSPLPYAAVACTGTLGYLRNALCSLRTGRSSPRRRRCAPQVPPRRLQESRFVPAPAAGRVPGVTRSCTPGERSSPRDNDQPIASFLTAQRGQDAVNPVSVLHWEVEELQRERPRRDSQIRQTTSANQTTRIVDVPYPRDPRRDFFEQFGPLRNEAGVNDPSYSSDIPAWPGQAHHETGPDGVTTHSHPNNRQRLGHILGGQQSHARIDDDEIQVEPHQFSGESRIAFGLAVCPLVLDGDGLPIDIAEVAESSAERGDVGLIRGLGFRRD